MVEAKMLPDTGFTSKSQLLRRVAYVGAVVLAAALQLAVLFWTWQGDLHSFAASAAVAPYLIAAQGASSVSSLRGFGLLSQPYLHEPIYGSTRNMSSRCPPWFWEYAAFHNAHRGQPNTKYILAGDGAFGLGDRLHGALSMLRMAKALNRVLLLRWQSPYPLEDFFEPPGALNWTTQGITIEEGPQVVFIDPPAWRDSRLHDGSMLSINDTFITVVTNMELHRPCHGCPDTPSSEWSEEAACIWQNMFRPVEAILQQARVQLQQLYPGGMQPYVAAHLRLGGLEGERDGPGYERGKAPLENVIASLRCASKLATNSSIDLGTTPVLVITDNHNLRRMLQENIVGRVVTPPGLPVHVSKAGGQTLEAHRSTVVDMVLLAWSECLATSKSGFSLHAWLYGGAKPCRLPWTTCL